MYQTPSSTYTVYCTLNILDIIAQFKEMFLSKPDDIKNFSFKFDSAYFSLSF